MLENLQRRTLREEALDSLRNAILDGVFPPGTHLGEVALSEQLNISRGTIREALRSLQQSGLVEAAPRGLRVKRLSPQEVRDLYATRGALESLAMTTIMEKEDARERILEISEFLPPEDLAGINFSECLERDLEFHKMLAHASDNQVLIRVWEELQDQMRVAILADETKAARSIMSRQHHEPIIQAMQAGDAAGATELITQHMRYAAELLSPKEDS
jgi:DNA-binding GntR family transcriptional regulator